MPDSEQLVKRVSSFKTIVIFLIGFGVGYVASGIAGLMSRLATEYESAAVAREITIFVTTNKTWPASWRAIDMAPLSQVKVNWSLDLSTCDRHDVMMSVAPEAGAFYTYPHAERQLADLWHVVLQVREQRSNQAINGDCP